MSWCDCAAIRQGRYVPARRPVAFVIDDSEDAQSLFTEALEAAGFRVFQAMNGWSALDLLFEHRQPDLIVLDLVMPGMSGLVLLELLSTYERFAAVPVLVVTATAPEHAFPTFNGRLLMKPIDEDAFARHVNEVAPPPRRRRGAA
jgi:CheY-like chemotaxis protein